MTPRKAVTEGVPGPSFTRRSDVSYTSGSRRLMGSVQAHPDTVASTLEPTMNLLRVLSFPGADRQPSPRVLLCAAVVAVALLAVFVDLLHDAVARGDQWRQAQRTSAGGAAVVVANNVVAGLR